MTMCFINRVPLTYFLFFATTFFLSAQDNLTGYWNPKASLNYKVTTNYTHNFSFEKRSYLYRDSELQLKVKQIDLSHFSNLKIKDNQQIGLGIKYRFSNTFDDDYENELRITQQYSISFKNGNFRYGNRLRAEQRIMNSRTVHRFRYRFAVDFPLQGTKLDTGESYIVLSTASHLSVGKAMSSEYDQRVTTKLGWLLTSSTKFQIGTEYRMENYTNTIENKLFLLSELVLSL